MLGGLEERQELRVVPLLAVDDRVELGALEAEDGDRALQLVDGGLDVLHRQRGQAGEALRALARHAGDLVVDLAGELPPLRGVEVVAEERRVDRDHLHVDALGVHVLQPLVGREAHLGRREGGALAAAHHDAHALAGLVAKAVPFLAGGGGPPQRLRHQVRVDVDGPHGRSSSRPRCQRSVAEAARAHTA